MNNREIYSHPLFLLAWIFFLVAGLSRIAFDIFSMDGIIYTIINISFYIASIICFGIMIVLSRRFNKAIKLREYKRIVVYIDTHGQLLGVPTGEAKYDGIIELDLIFPLLPQYTPAHIETFLLSLFDNCYSREAKTDTLTAIEKHCGAINSEGIIKRGIRCVQVSWKKGGGYVITPFKNAKTGYIGLKKRSKTVSEEFTEGDLAAAFIDALEYAV